MPESIAVANTETPLFEIELPREGKKLAPRSLEELEQWLQVERQAWNWLNEAKTDDAPIESLVNLMFHQDRGITKTLNAAKSAEVGEQRRQYIETLRTLLTERYVSHQAPTSEAPMSKRVTAIRTP